MILFLEEAEMLRNEISARLGRSRGLLAEHQHEMVGGHRLRRDDRTGCRENELEMLHHTTPEDHAPRLVRRVRFEQSHSVAAERLWLMACIRTTLRRAGMRRWRAHGDFLMTGTRGLRGKSRDNRTPR